MTSAVRVEGHVLRREPASRARGRPGATEVAQLTEDGGSRGAVR